MKNYILPFLVISCFAVLIGYQNCGKKSFSTSSKSTGSSLDTRSGNTGSGNNNGSGNVIVDNGAVDNAKTNCLNAQRLNKQMVLNQKIIFEDTKVESGRNQVCLFNQDGNLDILNGVMQARYEQEQKLNLPAGAVICDIQMTNSLQSFRYDDVFLFTFNDIVLATNNKTALFMSNPLQAINLDNSGPIDIYNYDWMRLRSLSFNNVADDYCLGDSRNAAQCSWPISEQQGQIYFDFDQETLIGLGLRSTAQNQRFGFIITGDNDRNIDCYHEKLEFDMSVKYYIQ